MDKKITAEIEETSAELLHALSSFTEEQFNQIPFEGSWTCGQVADHLLKSDMTKVLNGKAERTGRKPDEKVQQIKDSMLNFKIKMKNPEFNTPSHKRQDKEKMINSLKNVYKNAEEASGILDLTQTCIDFDMPGVGKLTRLEWLNFMVYHTQRHTHQIRNILQTLTT